MTVSFLRSLTCFCRWVYLLTRFATDNEADLFVWDIAEATVTLMAACIPTLRLFLKEKTSSGPSGERTTRLSQFSLSFRSANRGRRMFNTQDIEVIPEHSIEKGKVLAGGGASRDGSVAGTSAGSGSGGVVVGEKTIESTSTDEWVGLEGAEGQKRSSAWFPRIVISL